MVKCDQFHASKEKKEIVEGELVVVESGRHGRKFVILVSVRKHIKLTPFSECV